MRQIFTVLFLLLMAFLSPGLTARGEQSDQLSAASNVGWLFTSPEAVASDYTSICQDTVGLLWIGTDRGLLRFDGNHYETYVSNRSNPSAISDNRVLDILCDDKGRLWVATANGLNLYDPATDTFKVIPLPSLDFYGYVIAVDKMSDGTVIFVVSGIGLYIINETNGEPVAVRYLPNIQEEKNINTILCAPDGRVYAGARGGEICTIEPNGRLSLHKVCDNYVCDMAFDKNGNLLVADVNHIYRVKLKEDYEVVPLLSSAPINISRLSAQRHGIVYVGTHGSGLWRVPDGEDVVEPSSSIYSPFLNLSNANIGAVYSAPDGSIWLGCNYYGLVMIPSRNIPFTYRKLNDIFSDFSGGINAMTTWRDNVVLGLDKSRIGVLSPSGNLIMAVTLPGQGSLSSLTATEDNKVIAGMANDGLYEISLPEGSVKKILSVAATFPNIYVAPGYGDDLFVAIHGVGVMRYNRKTGEQTYLPVNPDGDRLTNAFVAGMCRSSDDKIWMGLFSGLAAFDLKGDSLIAIDQTPFLSSTSYSIAETDNGEIAVGTSDGLIIYDRAKGKLEKFTTDDGLVANEIRDMAVDRKGGLWLATLHGLSFIDPDDKSFKSFHGGYGLVENAFSHIDISGDGKNVYMGSNLGVTSFNPDSVLASGLGTKIKISGIYLGGRRIPPSEKLAGRPIIEGNPNSPSAIYLPYKSNSITLRLATTDFRDGNNIVYRWQIEGYGKEWYSTVPGDALIYLPHLDPGKYRLKIEALENGLISEPIVIDVHVSTPWYITWWVKILYVLIFLTLVVLLFLEWKRRRRAKEDDARIKFFMDISHDIRSPITLIMSPLEQLMKEPFNSDVKMKLKTMHRNSQRILSLVNQLLEVRKLEKGKMRLNCRLTDMNTFVSELVEMFKPQAEEKKQTLEFVAGEDIPDIWVDRQNFDKILVNLISNAIKYTPEGGKIEVRNSLIDHPEIGESVEVSVIDTGIGLDAKTEHRLFERFYQGEGHGASKTGFGIGLDLCRRLVDFHHGAISGRNRNDGVSGSVFSVALPVGPDSYTPEELADYAGAPVAADARGVRDVILPIATPGETETVRTPKSAGQKTILVVDDDTELREYISSHFRKHYKVKSASDGLEAMRIVADTPPDLIVSDVIMPGLDGLTLLNRLKKNADTHHIPVVLLSSKQDIADRMAGWDRGADGYVGKPFHIEELEALVDNLIDNRLRMKGKFSGTQDTEGKISAPEMKGNDEMLLERVMKIIDRNIEDPKLNVENLAQEVGLSRAHLHRKMKELVGMTPGDFIRTIRMRRACELLKKGDVAVTQVAYKVGFTSQPHFSTIFKSFTGFTPSEYRDKSESGEVDIPAAPND